MWRGIAPKIARRHLPDLLRLAGIGALIAGVYGALHDQVTYTISEEYFTKAKFAQFAWADPGIGPRGFAGIVGILASWWVGAIAGWLLGRLALPRMERPAAMIVVAKGFAGVFGGAFAGGGIGGLIGWQISQSASLENWRWLQHDLDVERLESFVTVVCIHNGGYAGAALGFVVATAWILRMASSSGG